MMKSREWIVSAFLLSLWACGSPEQATLDQFFRAAQAGDSTTVAYMSAVSPPAEVESWKVVEVTSRTTEAFTLPELVGRFEVAKKERDAERERREKYFKDNQDALEQIIPKLRDDPDYKFRGKLGAIQEEWAKLVAAREEQESAFQELRRTVDRETGLATKSVVRQLNVSDLKGAIAVTEMLLNIKPKDHVELPFKVFLRKYNLSEGESDRVEPARWVIVDIEAATEEARAAVAQLATKPSSPSPPSKAASVKEASTVADSESSAESKRPARREATHIPVELRGPAKVQILTPVTKVEGDEVVSSIRVRNASKDWITGFMVTEHWYDQQGNVVGSSSRTHRERFMPGEIIEFELRTRKGSNFYQSQYEFSHANGGVQATTVGSFPKQTT